MSDTSDLIGRIFDSRYQITALVGRGGMGTVYKAVHVAMNQVVALKVLHREMSRDERQVQRFYQEARASSRLKHPNTIKVFDFGRSDEGHLYLAMEFLEGQTLTQLLRREGALPARRALNIVRQVAKALAEAHMNGLVHRDLKPDNIFITQIYGEEDFVKVLDFGIAKFLQGNPEYGALTQAGLVCGTPLYLSPEQALGRTLDGRSDLYSLGVILYEMLSGIPPFRAETPVALVMRHIHDPPPPLGGAAGGVPDPVRALVFALLDKDRDRRPASAEALIGLLDEAMATVPVPTRPVVAHPVPAPPRVEPVRTRIEALRPGNHPPDGGAPGSLPSDASPGVGAPLPRREEVPEGATQALPFAPPSIPPVGSDDTRPEPGAAARPVVDRDAPTIHLSRSSMGLGGDRSRPPAAVEEDEETVVVSLSDSGPAQPVAVAGPPRPPAGRSTRATPVSGPDDSTRIEPPSVIPAARAHVSRSRAGRRGATRFLVVALVVVTAGTAGVGVATLIQGRNGGGTPAVVASGVTADPGPAASSQESPPGPAAGGPSRSPDTPPPPEPPPPREVRLTFETAPVGAEVFLDDRKVGATPLILTLREGEAPVTLRFVADGFEEARLTVDPAEAVRSGRTMHRLVLDRKPAPVVTERGNVRGRSAEATRSATKGSPRRPESPARPAAPKKKPAPALQWE